MITLRLRFNASFILALFCFFSIAPGYAQNDGTETLYGSGVARINEGDIAKARQNALLDAQKKAVLQAVCTMLPFDAFSDYYLALANLFFTQPDLYLQRFKIIEERSLFDLYRVTIAGAVQKQLLKDALISVGVLNPEPEKAGILLMMASWDTDNPEPSYWWSSNQAASRPFDEPQQTLKEYFIRKGAVVINPLDSGGEMPLEEIRESPEPDLKAVSRFASALGA